MIDNSRESDGPREKHYSIELPDREHLEKLGVKFMEDIGDVKFVHRPVEDMKMTPLLKNKKELAEKLSKEIKVIDLYETSKSKAIKRKPEKNNSKSHAAAVEKV